MKTAVFTLCFLCATAALGQSVGGAALSNEAQPIQFISHPQHASRHSMATEQNLLDSSDYVYAQGERPLWEVAQASHTTPLPLGDVARLLKKERASAKRADIVWNN